MLFFKRQLHSTLLIVITGILAQPDLYLFSKNMLSLEECIVTRGQLVGSAVVRMFTKP